MSDKTITTTATLALKPWEPIMQAYAKAWTPRKPRL